MKNCYCVAMLLASVLYTGMQHRAHASAEETEQLVRNALSLDANRGRGESLFRSECTGCHADDGRGDDDGFVPSLRNQHYRYLLREMEAMAVGHRALDPELMRFLGSLSGDELVGIADYVSRLCGPIVDRVRLRDDGSLSD